MSNGSFDFAELDQLAGDLGDVPKNSGPFINSALQVSSQKIQKAWQEKLRGSVMLPQLPYALSYDVTTFQGFGVSLIKSDIGFDKHRPQGALGNVSEFGTPTTPPRAFGLASLHENEADFQHGLEMAVDDALKESGL